jgi:hypothetical protein
MISLLSLYRPGVRRIPVLAMALSAAVLVLASSTSARVVVDACIGGIGLWDNSTRVLREWGEPVRKERVAPDTWWRYRNGSVLLTRWGREPAPNRIIVLAVTTTDPREKTPAGIGPGSKLAEVRAAYPRAACRARGPCDIGKRRGRFTTLQLRRGRVTKVTISLESSFDDGRLQAPDRRCGG